jgi:hypothetical protein
LIGRFDRFYPALLQAPDFEASLRFCSAGIVKFRGFAARNQHYRPGLVQQAMRGASVAAVVRATAN